jgi:hypothetical protein
MKLGAVKTVLIRGRGRTRGKRLINFDSIRRMLAELEAAESPGATGGHGEA